ncbi:MAG TPA: Rieske (2Fe-2S) protein [Microbacteriaceae bacterium]
MKRISLLKVVDRLENASTLDPLVNGLRSAVNAIVRPRWLRDVLHGVPIGHPLHPLAVQIPLGAWMSAALLDLIPGNGRAARLLVVTGVVSALPAAAAGYTDWSKLHEQQLRVGVIHSTANLLATGLYTASFVQRCRGKNTSGKALGYTAFALLAGGGFLGGHLTYRQASGVNHTEDVPHRFPQGWHPLAPLDELPTGRLEHRLLGEIPLLVFRQGNEIDVLSDLCSHLSGPLHEGDIIADEGTCVVCPWHESVFSLRTGEVIHGPATSAQPKLLTRVSDGIVEVCLPGAS